MKRITQQDGVTQREISQKSGLDEAIISLIANGRYNPDAVQRAKIAAALGRPESEVF